MTNKIIKNKIVSIVWRPWEWKTFFWVFLASFYKRIYANVDIFQGWKLLNKKIVNIWDVNSISYDDTKGVVLLDEWGINVNARKSMSDSNMEFWELAMLWRKKNVDIIIISQLKRMVDVYFRELANYVFEMRSYFVSKDYLMFECKVYNEYGWIQKVLKMDLIEFTNLTWITYDTKESSRIEKTKKTIDYSQIETLLQ